MNINNKKHKILFSGGGTGGSVAPLLAVAEELVNPLNPPLQGGQNAPLQKGGMGGFEFFWLGAKGGIEREMVLGAGIKFKTIMAGKWRRYFSLKNFIDLFKIKIAFFQALWIMIKWRPDLAMSAGSFISVPVAWAAWVLRVPVIIHQQDARPGLANKLMAPFAKIITVTFEKLLADYGKKAIWVGNPIRKEIRNWKFSAPGGPAFGREIRKLKDRYKIDRQLPVVLILGGGTGAMAINQLVTQGLKELTKFCYTILITGKLKNPNFQFPISNFQVFEFLSMEQLAEAYAAADVVVTRAGMSALSELSYLAKPCIIIPLPESHQEENAAMFKEAAVVLKQNDLTAEKFAGVVKNLLADKERQKELGEKMGRVMKSGANEAVIKIVLGLL